MNFVGDTGWVQCLSLYLYLSVSPSLSLSLYTRRGPLTAAARAALESPVV